MTAFATYEELSRFIGEDIPPPPSDRMTQFLDYASAIVRAYIRQEPAGQDEIDLVKAVTLQIAARAFTHNKGSEFEQFGGAASEASGFAPEFLTYRHELAALRNLAHSGVG